MDRAAGRDLQPQGLAIVALLQALAQSGAQVLHFFLVHRQIGMAGDTELGKLGDLAPGKQVVQVRTDQAGDGDEVRLLGALDRRHAEEARQDARHLHDGDLVLAAESVLAREAHDEVERLVRHLRERMGRVQPHRHQQRLHFLDEELLDPAALARIALAVRDQLDALLLQQRQQLVVVDGVLLGDQRMHLVRELFVGQRGEGAALFVGPGRRQVGATRTSKNSSRLLETMLK